jgi:hypothetical protein
MKPFHYNQDPLYAVAAAILNNKDCHESIDEAAKANDPANLRRIISNHTELLRKAPDSKAKEFHRVAIANAKEKLKSLGESDDSEEQLEEAKDYKLKSLPLAQLVSRKKTLENQIGYLEDKQGFAPEELKAEFRAIDAEIESRKSMKEGDEGFYSQKMIKNQLQTIVRNANACLQMIESGRKFPEWAQSEIAVAEDGVVSVTEFMQSHSDGTKLD